MALFLCKSCRPSLGDSNKLFSCNPHIRGSRMLLSLLFSGKEDHWHWLMNYDDNLIY
jgi:hypothetical protein